MGSSSKQQQQAAYYYYYYYILHYYDIDCCYFVHPIAKSAFLPHADDLCHVVVLLLEPLELVLLHSRCR